jgi:hypothetical protein
MVFSFLSKVEFVPKWPSSVRAMAVRCDRKHHFGIFVWDDYG